MRSSDWSSGVCSSDLRMDWSRTTWSSLAVLMRWIAAKPLAHVEMAGRCPQRIGERTASGSIGKYPKRDFCAAQGPLDRKSVVQGKSVSVRVDLGGRRIIKKKKEDNNT